MTAGAEIADFDLHLFAEGRHRHAQSFLGAHCIGADGGDGVRFATWAPNAAAVCVMGSFNRWDPRSLPLQPLGRSGVWSALVTNARAGDLYKFVISGADGRQQEAKTDPYGRRFEKRPQTAAVVEPPTAFEWHDAAWLSSRAQGSWQQAPMSIYELHLGSWRRAADGGFLDYRALAEAVGDHVERLGFTHVELLPVTEHPLDLSWGYQVTGYFAPSARFGAPDDFRWFVDHLHSRGIGVLLDWVPAHFPRDSHALARFDGTALYEHADPRRGEHRDWGTLIFNYARHEVRSFLVSSALYWAEAFHVDGLRVDAVASMLYLDYSREAGDWLPNQHGGRENLEAVALLRELNSVVQTECPGVVMVAEESTAWPQVTQPPDVGGLGFSMKWNMGWMHDTLEYFESDPLFRKHRHDKLTFGMMYAHSENYVLPFSHDEVVHGKRSLLGKMPGDAWRRFANLRALYVYMFSYPGKKCLFMGAELADPHEWSEARSLDWTLLDQADNAGVQTLVAELNAMYRRLPALHLHDFAPQDGFEWLDCEDHERSVLSYVRKGAAEDAEVVVCLNFTPVPREAYRVGVPHAGRYSERLNSDARRFGGSGVTNAGRLVSEKTPANGRAQSLCLRLPPLAGVMLVRETLSAADAADAAEAAGEG